MSKSSIRIRRSIRITAKVIAVILSLAVICLIYTSVIGCPGWMVKKICDKASLGDYVVLASEINTDLIGRLILKDTTVYRKKVIGPPMIEAGDLVIALNIPGLFTGKDIVRNVTVENGIVRIVNTSHDQKKKTESGAASRLEIDCTFMNTRVEGVLINELNCSVELLGPVINISRMYGILGSLDSKKINLEGDIRLDDTKQTVSGRINTAFDPAILTELILKYDMPFTAELVNRFKWKSYAPVVRTAFEMKSDGTGDFRSNSEFAMTNLTYAGVDVERVDGFVEVNYWGTNAYVAVKPINIVRHEGHAEGWFTVYDKLEIVEFDAVSLIDPKAMFKMIGVFNDKDMKDWVFNGPVKMEATGVCDYGGWKKTDFKGYMSGYEIGIKPYVAEKCRFDMDMRSNTNRISNLDCTIYGGKLTGEMLFVYDYIATSTTSYRAACRLDKASFGDLTKVALDDSKSEYEGTFDGELDITGILDDTSKKSVLGVGSFRVSKGYIYRLPVFGGLSDIMTRMIPGLEMVLNQSEAEGKFSISNGRIHSDKIKIEGDVFSLTASGDYSFGGKIDYDVQLELMKDHTLLAKLLRFVTYPITKLLEFKLTGSVDKAKWYPENFSSDLLEKIGIKNGKSDEKDSGK